MLLTAALSDDGDLARTRQAVGTAVGDMAAEMDSLRAIISDLRPPALDELGLLAATESLVDRYRGRNGHTIDTDLTLLSTDAARRDPGPRVREHRLQDRSGGPHERVQARRRRHRAPGDPRVRLDA